MTIYVIPTLGLVAGGGVAGWFLRGFVDRWRELRPYLPIPDEAPRDAV